MRMLCTQPARRSRKASSPAAAWRWFAPFPRSDKLIETLEGDEKIGAQIVRRSLEEPLRQIVANAGEEGAVVVAKVLESKEPHYGYNAQTGKFEDLVKAGVIDPTKVTRTALQNAASIAALLLTTEALVVEIPEPKAAPAAAATAAAWTACTKTAGSREGRESESPVPCPVLN